MRVVMDEPEKSKKIRYRTSVKVIKINIHRFVVQISNFA